MPQGQGSRRNQSPIPAKNHTRSKGEPRERGCGWGSHGTRISLVEKKASKSRRRACPISPPPPPQRTDSCWLVSAGGGGFPELESRSGSRQEEGSGWGWFGESSRRRRRDRSSQVFSVFFFFFLSTSLVFLARDPGKKHTRLQECRMECFFFFAALMVFLSSVWFETLLELV